jgi:hypothetical protein
MRDVFEILRHVKGAVSNLREKHQVKLVVTDIVAAISWVALIVFEFAL